MTTDLQADFPLIFEEIKVSSSAACITVKYSQAWTYFAALHTLQSRSSKKLLKQLMRIRYDAGYNGVPV
jgi:hypothetical protein